VNLNQVSYLGGPHIVELVGYIYIILIYIYIYIMNPYEPRNFKAFHPLMSQKKPLRLGSVLSDPGTRPA
jgi:hypothetical protein